MAVIAGLTWLCIILYYILSEIQVLAVIAGLTWLCIILYYILSEIQVLAVIAGLTWLYYFLLKYQQKDTDITVTVPVVKEVFIVALCFFFFTCVHRT